MVGGTASVATSIQPLLRTASVNGTGIDLSNTGSTLVAFICGANTDGTFTPKLQDSPDNSSWTDVASNFTVGTLIAMAANTVQTQKYIGGQRYLRAVITVTGSPATGANVQASVISGLQRKVS